MLRFLLASRGASSRRAMRRVHAMQIAQSVLCLLAPMTIGCGGSVSSTTQPTDGGVDSDAPSPADASPHSKWVTLCKRLSGCGLWPDDGTLTGCLASEPSIGQESFYPPAMVDCIDRSGATCDDARICLNNGDSAFACDADAGAQPSCSGDLLSSCSATGNRITVDCRQLGLTCVVGSSFVDCAAPTCDVSGTSVCSNGEPFNCEALPDGGTAGVPAGRCDAFEGASCSAMPDGGAGCVGSGPACAGATCESDTVLLACLVGKQAHVDCAKMGLQCVSASGTASCALSTDCDILTRDRCNGTVLTYCDSGRLTTIDCAAEDFSRCISTPRGDRCSGP